MTVKIHYAVLSGLCASAASLFGKLFGLPRLQDHLPLRILLLLLMLLCNAGVWTLFVKALQEEGSSLRATVMSAASNYILSALVGYFVMGEVTGLLWWFGMSLIILGLGLIIKDQETDVKVKIS